MKVAKDILQKLAKQQVDRYAEVMVMLEDAFSNYETRRISINGYLEAVCAIERSVRRERAMWLQLCDWSLALRWINRAERRAFVETCEALDWCRNWAIRQRGVDVTACLQSVSACETVEPDFVPELGLAA